MRGESQAVKNPQQWIAERWVKHSDSVSIADAFAHRSSWNPLTLPDRGGNVVAMQSLAAALANESRLVSLDATRLAWRMAVEDGAYQSLVDICSSLSQLGGDPWSTPELQGFRQRSHDLALAISKAIRWTLGEHLVHATWARVLRNRGEMGSFARIASQLDQPRVLRQVLSGEASAVQRFQVVQTLSLYELERRSGPTRLDWILGLLTELGADLEAGSTSMRVLLVESESALRRGDFNLALVAALQLTDHMLNGRSELCSRADLAALLRGLQSTFAPGDQAGLVEEACRVVAAPFSPDKALLDSLARDMDRMADTLPAGLRASLPRLAPRETRDPGSASGVVLKFPLK